MGHFGPLARNYSGKQDLHVGAVHHSPLVRRGKRETCLKRFAPQPDLSFWNTATAWFCSDEMVAVLICIHVTLWQLDDASLEQFLNHQQ